MNKLHLYKIVFIFLLAISLIGCTNEQNEDYFYKFYDDLNQEIKLKEKPKKVAVLFSSFAEVWILAGGEVNISVYESVERGFASNDVILVDSGAGKTINLELLVSSQADFVICSKDIEAQVNASKLLNSNGIPAACFKVEHFNDYLKMLDVCTDILERKDLYKINGLEVKERIDLIFDSLNKDIIYKNILFVRAGSSNKSTKAKIAKDHFVAQMLDEIKTYNIANNAKVLLDGLSVEEILIENPDYIFISTMGNLEGAMSYMDSLLSSEVWSNLDAVKNKNYVYLPKELFQFKPNNKWDIAYQYLVDICYGK